MKLRSVIAKIAGGGMLAASLIMASPISALACTQIYMGKALTTTGDTYVGRSEDYSSRYVKAFGIQQREENPKFTSYENGAVDGSGFQWTYQGTSYRYTYVRDLPSEWGAENSASASKVYSEAGINERGVSVSATDSTSMNTGISALDPVVDTGIGEYNLADVILSIADSARDGVKKLGAIIDQYGSCECNQIIIADSSETFIFCQLSGHQWIALKMPDDKVAVTPNLSGLQYKVNLDDESVCLHSANIVEMPQDARLLQTYADGTPNIFKTYGDSNVNGRYKLARDYFKAQLDSGSDAEGPQLAFTPGIQIDSFTAMRSFAAKSTSGNPTSNYSDIGSQVTTETSMFQIRSGLSSDIAAVQWTALAPAEYSVFIPSYSALLTEVPEDLYPAWNTIDGSHAGGGVQNALEEAPDVTGKNLDYIMMDINTIASSYLNSMGANTRAYLDAVQKSIIAQQDAVDAVMKTTPAGEARTELANKAFAAVSEQVYAKAKTLLDEMRAFVKAGDTSAAFVPSDYDAATGSMKTGLTYGAAIVAPTITAQPASATYTVGDKAADLSVAATLADGVEGSNATLAYQWFKKGSDGHLVAIEGATSSTLAVDTATAGSATYQVTVTNAVGLAATSTEATITVNEAKKDPDQTPTPTDPDKKPADDTKTPAATKKPTTKAALPKTGDDSSALMAVTVAMGVAALVAGAALALEHRRQ